MNARRIIVAVICTLMLAATYAMASGPSLQGEELYKYLSKKSSAREMPRSWTG